MTLATDDRRVSHSSMAQQQNRRPSIGITKTTSSLPKRSQQSMPQTYTRQQLKSTSDSSSAVGATGVTGIAGINGNIGNTGRLETSSIASIQNSLNASHIHLPPRLSPSLNSSRIASRRLRTISDATPLISSSSTISSSNTHRGGSHRSHVSHDNHQTISTRSATSTSTNALDHRRRTSLKDLSTVASTIAKADARARQRATVDFSRLKSKAQGVHDRSRSATTSSALAAPGYSVNNVKTSTPISNSQASTPTGSVRPFPTTSARRPSRAKSPWAIIKASVDWTGDDRKDDTKCTRRQQAKEEALRLLDGLGPSPTQCRSRPPTSGTSSRPATPGTVIPPPTPSSRTIRNTSIRRRTQTLPSSTNPPISKSVDLPPLQISALPTLVSHKLSKPPRSPPPSGSRIPPPKPIISPTIPATASRAIFASSSRFGYSASTKGAEKKEKSPPPSMNSSTSSLYKSKIPTFTPKTSPQAMTANVRSNIPNASISNSSSNYKNPFTATDAIETSDGNSIAFSRSIQRKGRKSSIDTNSSDHSFNVTFDQSFGKPLVSESTLDKVEDAFTQLDNLDSLSLRRISLSPKKERTLHSKTLTVADAWDEAIVENTTRLRRVERAIDSLVSDGTFGSTSRPTVNGRLMRTEEKGIEVHTAVTTDATPLSTSSWSSPKPGSTTYDELQDHLSALEVKTSSGLDVDRVISELNSHHNRHPSVQSSTKSLSISSTSLSNSKRYPPSNKSCKIPTPTSGHDIKSNNKVNLIIFPRKSTDVVSSPKVSTTEYDSKSSSASHPMGLRSSDNGFAMSPRSQYVVDVESPNWSESAFDSPLIKSADRFDSVRKISREKASSIIESPLPEIKRTARKSLADLASLSRSASTLHMKVGVTLARSNSKRSEVSDPKESPRSGGGRKSSIASTFLGRMSPFSKNNLIMTPKSATMPPPPHQSEQEQQSVKTPRSPALSDTGMSLVSRSKTAIRANRSHTLKHSAASDLLSSLSVNIDPQLTSSSLTQSMSRNTTRFPRTGQQVVKEMTHQLTAYERMEILNYPLVYFLGLSKSSKTPARPERSTLNYGYDDERGEYKWKQGDHVAYRYEIISSLGKGSFGNVLKCRDHAKGTDVAVKIIRNRAAFQEQAQVEVAMLEFIKKHDHMDTCHIIRPLDHFEFRRHLCIVTEVLSMNLYEFIKANDFKGFSTDLIRTFAIQILKALALLYKHGIVHCDLKPENILMQDPHKSIIKVIDFGSSCYESARKFSYIQSRFYRSPEVLVGQAYGPAIDMWSLGCILAELAIGYPIFPGEDERDQMACIIEVLGIPHKRLWQNGTRASQYFHSDGRLRTFKNSKGKIRRPSARPLATVLRRYNDNAFIDFIAECLHMDPQRRMRPIEALEHRWIRRGISSSTVTCSYPQKSV